MGLLDRFKKRPQVSREQLSYDIAYGIFPNYAYHQLEVLLDIVESSPDSAHALFYFIACKAREIETQRDEADMYRWHKISEDPSRVLLILEHPSPVPLDLTGQSIEHIKATVGSWVLGPYFSALVMDHRNEKLFYFVLGQTSMGGGTVLRAVTADGENINLGPGTEPELQAFLALVDRNVSDRA